MDRNADKKMFNGYYGCVPIWKNSLWNLSRNEVVYMYEEHKKIGIDGLIEALKRNKFEPVGIINPNRFMLNITEPTDKRDGKVTLQLPNAIFDNSMDARKFNVGKTKMFLLFVEGQSNDNDNL
jgi:hypothetical protein